MELQNSYDIDISNIKNKNNPKNTKINDENININEQNDQSNSNIKDSNTLKIKQRLSISLLHQMQRNPKISSQEKAKINEIIEEVKTKNYLYGLSDLNGANKDLIISMNQKKENITKPGIVQLPDSIDYDIEFYKIGKKCNGLKKRYAIIKKGRLFSSDKPLKQLDKKKLKEKTQFLEGAEIYCDTIKDQREEGGEWANKNKKYRIRIDYLEDKVKNNYSSFFLYFDDKKEMNEVNLALFNICKKDNYKLIAKNTIQNLKQILIDGNKFYTILKILLVKSNFKKRKTSNSINDNSIQHSAIKFKNNNIIDKGNNNIIKKDEIEIGNSSIKDDKIPNLYGKKQPNKTNNYSLQLSENMPLISNMLSGKEKNNNKNEISLNDLITKIHSLKNIIPKNVLKEQNDEENKNGICFQIQQGIEIQNNSGNNTGFKLQNNLCKNTRYIYFNKNKPEILLKEKNYDDNDINYNGLSANNIYEISNVIKNSNNNLHDEEENNLIILGPKFNNNKGISYKYKNNDSSFSDPENINIKKMTINTINNKQEKVINLKIIKKELDINSPSIKTLLDTITNNQQIDNNQIKNLLFWYKIRLSQLKYIESSLVQPISFKEGFCSIEYNHQYFIPIDYFNRNQEIIIETYIIPLSYFDQSKYNQISYMTKLLSSKKIGYSIINLKNIKERKNKYEIINENDIPIINSFFNINGSEEKMEMINIPNIIEGKDYSIGNDSYIIKNINKDFIEKVKNNKNISDNIKKKYFNVKFDSNGKKEFLFRPNENMDENDFIKDISNQISKRDLDNILKNKKFNYLPYCEKYMDKESLFKSKNLRCFPEVYKYYIIDNYNPGQWIYKIPEIKVKILSKNLGILKNINKISQKLYCIEEEQTFPLESLIKIDTDEERIIPISENNFNIFNFKELNSIDIDNYQWKISIKFNNSLQMESFIKLLNIAKQNINAKKKIENKNMFLEFKNLNNFDNLGTQKNFLNSINSEHSKIEMGNKCEIIIEYIDFLKEFNLTNNPSILEAKLILEIKTDKYIIQIADGQEQSKEFIMPFSKQMQIDKKKFNNSKKIIYYKGNLIFDCDKIQMNKNIYKLVIKFGGFEFFTQLDIHKTLNNTNYSILELPLYILDEQGNNIIYALIEITISEINPNSNYNYKKKYIEYNRKYLKEPLLLLKEDSNNILSDFTSKNSHFGLNEPNVFRRKIMNMIHNDININIDPFNLDKHNENELKILYRLLNKECVILPNLSNFAYFQFPDLKRNNSLNEMSNSYRKKLGMELLRIKRHNEFMRLFRENRWYLFLKKIKKGDEYKDPFEYFSNLQDKRLIFKNKKEIDNLQNLMYLGVPSKQYRQVVYSLLLDLTKFFDKTRIILYNKYKEEANSPQNLFSFFANQLYDHDPKINIIFSLIDNDINYISSIDNISLEEINNIKKIAKAFFIWAELRIGLNDNNDKYVYFIGLLSLTQKLLKYFEDTYFVFWILIGLSQNIAHFHQKNPLFSEEINYINIYGLVTKLIMERHQPKIYDKFISLNIPPELFISRHLSTFFTDYFKDELMMRILDIIIFESSFQNEFSDNMQYLRILCAIPLTLFAFNEDRILACKSVSEIESITNDLNLYTFNHNGFISKLEKNISSYFVISNILEKWFFNNKGREWDYKRGEMENLMKRHFYPIVKENRNYLYDISSKLKSNTQDIVDIYFDNLDKNMNSLKSIYLQGKADICDSNNVNMGIGIQISKLRQIYNNEHCDMNRYKLNVSFGNVAGEMEKKYKKAEYIINFDTKNNEIININDLFYKSQYPIQAFPKYVIFILLDENKNKKATFSYRILNYELMKISKIILENIEETNKFYLEFVLFKFATKKISEDDLSIYNNLFSSPEYFHSLKIEEKLYSYNISNSSFNKNISELIKIQNNTRNNLINGAGFDQSMVEIFQKINNNKEKEDNYNQERVKFIIKKDKDLTDNIAQQILNIIESCMKNDISNIFKNWLNDSNISIEEIFYGIILVDKSLISINEKLFTIYSVGQLRDKFLFNIDEISVPKVKEIIYSLYKRFRVYFTKTDVERMIDFLLKDERLLNIKYALVHNKNDIMKINDMIYDKDYYEPNINKEKKAFEIFFDDITKELIIFLNHLRNHYNLNTFSYDIISFIFKSILNQKDLNKYKQNNFDIITLVIEKDDILYKRYYNISYSPSLNINEEMIPPNFIKPKNDKDYLNCELCYEISNIDINNFYNTTNYINFNKFKEIFFKLPYLSDLFRVSFSYLSIDSNISKKEFESFKVIVGYEGYSQNIFYFPYKQYEDELENEDDNIIKYDMNQNIKISDTVDKILNDIVKKINDKKIRINNEEAIIIDYLKSFYKIECYIWYDLDEFKPGRIMQEIIGYFDNLYSCIALKNKNRAELHIIFNNDVMTLNSKRKPVQKEDGYCKIYYSTNNDFYWKKCKFKRQNMDHTRLTSADYKSTPRILNKNDDILLAYDV